MAVVQRYFLFLVLPLWCFTAFFIHLDLLLSQHDEAPPGYMSVHRAAHHHPHMHEYTHSQSHTRVNQGRNRTRGQTKTKDYYPVNRRVVFEDGANKY